jgi:hypothetical protein
MSKRLDPALFARAIMLESAEIPADMTIAEWRRARQAPVCAPRGSRRRRRRRPLRLLRLS